MKTVRKIALPLALMAALALAPAALAQEPEGEVVPPENSAVTQYTESFPTGGGNRDVSKHEGRNASPGKVLGTRNADKLKRQGSTGRAVAELTADTAPAPAAPVIDSGGSSVTGNQATGDKGGSGSGKGGASKTPQQGNAPVDTPPPTVVAPEASGSSGLGAVLARAVGVSPSNGGGFLLLLLILATIVWAVAYSSRQRQAAG